MLHKIETKVVVHKFNGKEDDVQFVEIDGKKYIPDDTDKTKAKEVDGKKVEYVAPVPPKKDDAPDLSKMTTEEIANLNPEVKKLLQEKADREAADAKAKQDADLAAGKHEEVIKSKDAEIDKLKKELGTKGEILEKYVGSVKQVLEQVLKDIPKDNIGLIPESFSPREKLEYITKNAKLLGVKVGTGKGGGVPPNEDDPNTTDLQKYQAEFETLQKKEGKKASDFTRMAELGKLIKTERTKKS